MKWPSALLLACLLSGCGGTKSSQTIPPHPPVALAIQRPEGGLRVFPAGEDFAVGFPFEGANGSVRVTMEIQRFDDSADHPTPTLNDVLFRAEGRGRISIAFQKPRPGHHQGRVILRCESAGEESEAEFEPDLWMSHPSSIVTFDPITSDPASPVVEGREVVLAYFVARELPQDIRLTLEAVFSRESVPPRVKAGAKPPR